MRKNVKKNEPLYKVVTKSTYKPVEGRKFSLDSMTTPDDSLSVRQLLINYTRGLSPAPHRQGIYTGDEIAPRFVDLNDRKAAVDELRQRIEQAKEQIAQDKAHKEAKSKILSSGEQVDQGSTTEEAPQGA